MNRSFLTLFALSAALMLAGCATESMPSMPAASSAPAAGASPAVVAVLSDAAIAEKFKGQWTGEWIMPGFGSGKFVFIGAGVDGANVKGEAHWYGTAAGDVKLPLLQAAVEQSVLKAEQAGDIKFKLKMKSETELVGDWDIKGYTGELKLKR